MNHDEDDWEDEDPWDAVDGQQEAGAQCPYCGAWTPFPPDPQEQGQSWTLDCMNCCRPMRVTQDMGGGWSTDADG